MEALIFSSEGNNVKKICEPSRGGTGIKLNTPRIRLIQTKKLKKKAE